jgi:chromosomal replication initiator protein
MTADELWNAVLGELELEISKPNFVTWFDNTFLYSFDNGDVTIGVPSAFTKTWLEKQYHTSIVKALRRISEEDVKTVHYKVASKAHSKEADATESPASTATTTSTQSTSSSSTTTETRTPQKEMIAGVQQTLQAADIASVYGLNPRYTFKNFVVGKKNELAHAACMAAAEQPGTAYNPLFIYGGVGLGKTHLMQAVGHTILEKDPTKKILYVTCETFTNEYIKSVGEGRADEFKNKYRSVDVLMVDDIQFLAGKEGTQEAFFHTFNHLHQSNKQILLTSDRPPRAIPTLENRLISRFEGGMIVDVSLPDLETRIAILSQKCREKGYHIRPEIMQFIASNVQNNIRELEGALNRVIAYHELNKKTPTIESVQSILQSFSSAPKRSAVTTKKVLEVVAQYFDISLENLRGNSRKKELVVPRQISMFLMREEVHASYPNIGDELGGRDHTTAMHAHQKINQLKDKDEKIENDINLIKQRLYNS